MGKRSRDKGLRGERGIVHLLQERGYAAERVPLSGAAMGTRSKGDVTTPVLGIDRKLEVKVRANGFRELYGWLADNYAVVVRADRQKPLLVIPLDRAVDVLDVAEGRLVPFK